MVFRKIELHLVSKKFLKFIVRYKCEKKAETCPRKSVVCDKKKPCSPPAPFEGGDMAMKEKKDICVYAPCPVPCPVEPCTPDLPSPEAANPEEGFPSRYKTSIIVIGAGVSGLSCAHRLIEAGFKKTLILEAEDRPGGRIQSGWLKDSVIEKGSDFCCKQCNPFNNHIIQLGVKTGQLKVPLSGVDPSQGLLLQTDCTPIPLPISYMAWSHLSEILKEAECIRSQIPPTQSDLGEHYIGIRIHQLLKKLPPDMAMTCARLLLGLTSYLSPSLRKVANDSFGAYAVAANMRIPLGYLGALAPLLTDITPERILYNKKVLNIRWGTVTADQHPRAVLKCKDGSIYNADYVIITIPLGVLKANIDTMFCPPLSPAKEKAIKLINVGHKGKIFMEYDQPFWVWRDKKIQFNWTEGELSSRPNFTRGVISLEELKGSEYVIAASLKGCCVEEMERLTDAEISQLMTCFLMECLGDGCLPSPIKIIKTNWVTNPNFKGSFSSVPQGIAESDICAIGMPLPKECSEMSSILYFAGEHTCRADLMGTVRGAMISGVREAEKVIAAINRTEFQQHPSELLASC